MVILLVHRVVLMLILFGATVQVCYSAQYV